MGSNNDYYLESESSMFKLSAPIGRLKFMICFLISLILFWGINTLNLLFGSLLPLLVSPVVLVGVGTLAYICFIIVTSRLWDITGSRVLALAIGLIGFLLLYLNLYIPCAIIFACILFIPGKLIK